MVNQKSAKRTGEVQRLKDFADYLLRRYHAKSIAGLPSGPRQDYERARRRIFHEAGEGGQQQ